MSSPKKYEPPDTVVGPAMSELNNRLARSRVYVRGEMEVSDEEQKIFDYGVSERKRVLEHTLFLVFGQWAVYRQAISRLKWRGARIAYGVAAFASTSYFVGARAQRVSHEMFATIATTATSSPLGNEARVVLAELEGPDGPYFRQVCRDRGFAEDLTSVMAARDAEEGVDPSEDHLHAQLRLRPRLPVRPHGAMHPPIERRPGAERRDPRREVDFRPARVQRGRAWVAPEGESGVGMEVGRSRRENRKEEEAEVEVWEKPFDFRKTEARKVSRDMTKDEEPVQGELWGSPFNFKKAAEKTDGEWDGATGESDNAPDEPFADEKEQEEEITPSQRRAAERRSKRTRSRMRVETGER